MLGGTRLVRGSRRAWPGPARPVSGPPPEMRLIGGIGSHLVSSNFIVIGPIFSPLVSFFWFGPCILYTPTLKSRSNATRAHKTQKWLKNGPIWVRRPLDKCTGGETGPRKRFPLVPRPSEAKKDPKQPKFKTLPPITNGSNMGPITTDCDAATWKVRPGFASRFHGTSLLRKEPVFNQHVI